MRCQEDGELAITIEVAGELLGDEMDALSDRAIGVVELRAQYGEGALDEIVRGGIEYGVLRGEVVEEGGLADPQLMDDVLNAGAVEPERTEERQRSRHDRRAHLRLLLFAQSHVTPSDRNHRETRPCVS